MLVVDTSVVVKWVIPENGSGVEYGTAAAIELLAEELIAPDCLLGEFANAMFKKVRRGEIGRHQAKESLEILPTLLSLVPMPLLVDTALDLALDLVHPVHDCAFLTTAIMIDTDLVTADMKFLDACLQSKRQLPVRALGGKATP